MAGRKVNPDLRGGSPDLRISGSLGFLLEKINKRFGLCLAEGFLVVTTRGGVFFTPLIGDRRQVMAKTKDRLAAGWQMADRQIWGKQGKSASDLKGQLDLV